MRHTVRYWETQTPPKESTPEEDIQQVAVLNMRAAQTPTLLDSRPPGYFNGIGGIGFGEILQAEWSWEAELLLL
jgi:hypothetical protein